MEEGADNAAENREDAEDPEDEESAGRFVSVVDNNVEFADIDADVEAEDVSDVEDGGTRRNRCA